MRLIVSPQAEADLDEIWLFIAKESSSIDLAERVLESLMNRMQTIARHPMIGRRRDAHFGPGVRSFVVGDYVIFYRVVEDGISVLHVIHGRQNREDETLP